MVAEDTALRKAIVERLKADLSIAAIVGDRVYEEPPSFPVWPWIRYGVDIITPLRADGWRGATYSVTLHAFVNGPGQNVASDLARLIRLSLDEAEFPIDSLGGILLLQWSQGQILPSDGNNAGAYHAVVEFDAALAEIV